MCRFCDTLNINLYYLSYASLGSPLPYMMAIYVYVERWWLSPISHTHVVFLGVFCVCCVCSRRRLRNFINLILSKTTNEIIYLSVDNTHMGRESMFSYVLVTVLCSSRSVGESNRANIIAYEAQRPTVRWWIYITSYTTHIALYNVRIL